MSVFFPLRARGTARLVLALLCLLLALPVPAAVASDRCPPAGFDVERLRQLEQAGFDGLAESDREVLALALIGCLEHPDPWLRDAVAFSALSHWLRGGALSDRLRGQLLQQVIERLQGADDAEGFRHSFAALLLAELVRADRLARKLHEPSTAAAAHSSKRWLVVARCAPSARPDAVSATPAPVSSPRTAPQRPMCCPSGDALATNTHEVCGPAPHWDEAGLQRVRRLAVSWYVAIEDYRAFDEAQGWRHAVAHGADLLLQLALHPATDAAALESLLDALASQIAPAGSTGWRHAESERQARMAWWAFRRGLLPAAWWQRYIERISAPGPTMPDWNAAFSHSAGLARRHNLIGFLHELGLLARMQEDEASQQLARWLQQALLRVKGLQ